MLLLANGMFGTLLGLRSKHEGFSTEMIGFIMAGYSLGLLLGALFAVRVITQVGHIRSFAALASIMSVAVLCHLLWVDPLFWLLLRTVAGFCMAGMVMVTESWINDRAGNETRGQILSLYMITNYLGSGGGQLSLNIAPPEEFQLFLVASIVYSLALVPVLLTGATGPSPVPSKRMSMVELFGISPVGLIGTLAAGFCNSSVNNLGAVYAAEINLSVAQVSLFMASVLVGGMLLQLPIGRLSDKFDRRTVLFTVALVTGCCALGINWMVGKQDWQLFAMAAVYGGFAFTVYPLSCAQVNDMADRERLVQVSSGLLVAFGVGAIVGPIASAFVMGKFGAPGLFFVIAAVWALLAVFTLLRMAMRIRGDKPKAPYLPLGSVGIAGKQLYASIVKSVKQRAVKNATSKAASAK
ncbi:MAG: MFS transporter [Hyphomicrobiaceae bacterium TMED74]|nr:MFS transporter [Filomicrobium sp.]RPG40567.1 MAG: MFS transporter [Hyphomicrobiaceae bacterium TMED74]